MTDYLTFDNPYGLGMTYFRVPLNLSYSQKNTILQAYLHNPDTDDEVRQFLQFNFIEPRYTGDWTEDVFTRSVFYPTVNRGVDPMVHMEDRHYNIKRRLDRLMVFLRDNGLMIRDEQGPNWICYFNTEQTATPPINGGVFGNTAMTGTFGNPNPTFGAFGNAGNTTITPTARIRTQPPPNRSNERVGVKELAIRKAAIRGGVLTNRNRKYIEQIESENPPFKVNNPDSYNYLDVITHIPVQRRTGDLSSHAYMVNQMIKHAFEDNHITLPKLTDITEDWEFDADSPREAYEEALTLIPFHNNLLDLNKNKKKR